MRRYSLAAALTFVVSLVRERRRAGRRGRHEPGRRRSDDAFTYPTDQSSYFGVAMVPGTRSELTDSAGIPTVESRAPRASIPALTSDLFLPNTGLCSHGGAVIHSNETFALVWDPNPYRDWRRELRRAIPAGCRRRQRHAHLAVCASRRSTPTQRPRREPSLYGGGVRRPDGLPLQRTAVLIGYPVYAVGRAHTFPIAAAASTRQ